LFLTVLAIALHEVIAVEVEVEQDAGNYEGALLAGEVVVQDLEEVVLTDKCFISDLSM
jgi:hypothetical protein